MVRSSRNTLLACFLLVLGSVGLLLATFDPGRGPGNINAFNDLAVVNSCYTFTDGNYARGFIDFTKGFTVSPNSKVTLSLMLPVVLNDSAQVGFDVTSTIILEAPLVFEGEVPLQGSFQASLWSSGIATIQADGFSIMNNVFFPPYYFTPVSQYSATTARLYAQGGVIYRNEDAPLNTGIYLYEAPDHTSGSLDIRNAELFISDAPTSTWPIVRYDGLPFIRFIAPIQHAAIINFYDSTINVLEQASFYNLNLTFFGDCAIKNTAPLEVLSDVYNRRPLVASYPGGAQQARFIIDSGITTTYDQNYTLRTFAMSPPCSLVIGPNVAMKMGNLGLRRETIYPGGPGILPYGGIIKSVDSSRLVYNTVLTLIDSSITFSLPCTMEYGPRMIIQGNCDFYSISANPAYRIFTVGRWAQGDGLSSFPIDSVLDIQSGSVLNVHNMVLNNFNNP